MKSLFSEVERERLREAQLKLLKEDLESALIMIKNSKYRSAYIFLFDGLERLFDLWFIVAKRVKPSNRREREDLIFRFFPPNVLRKFRSLYYERRGGMYEDFVLINRRDFKSLLRFFNQVLEDLKKEIKIDNEIKDILEELEKS